MVFNLAPVIRPSVTRLHLLGTSEEIERGGGSMYIEMWMTSYNYYNNGSYVHRDELKMAVITVL